MLGCGRPSSLSLLTTFFWQGHLKEWLIIYKKSKSVEKKIEEKLRWRVSYKCLNSHFQISIKSFKDVLGACYSKFNFILNWLNVWYVRSLGHAPITAPFTKYYIYKGTFRRTLKMIFDKWKKEWQEITKFTKRQWYSLSCIKSTVRESSLPKG